MSIFSTYDNGRYIYPPRAEKTLPAAQLEGIDETGWIAQPKYNGSCAVLILNGTKDYQLYNRHKEPLTLQKPLQYNQLNDSENYMVLCGEYLNKNKKGEGGIPFNHKFVIWDILVYRGKYLLGETLQWRLTLLYELFGTSRAVITDTSFSMFDHLMATRVTDVYLAPTYTKYFKAVYDDLVKTDLYEGIVLKREDAKLIMAAGENNNSNWQVKVRKPTNNYSF